MTPLRGLNTRARPRASLARALLKRLDARKHGRKARINGCKEVGAQNLHLRNERADEA
jgi:hypothetical protein